MNMRSANSRLMLHRQSMSILYHDLNCVIYMYNFLICGNTVAIQLD